MHEVKLARATTPSLWRHPRMTPSRATLGVMLALLMGGSGVVHAETQATDPATSSQAADTSADSQAPEVVIGTRHRTVSPLDRRVALLAKELNLDAGQQARVKKVLENQRAQMNQVWNNTSLSPAMRVSSTQSIGDRTADQIRALLNEEQRKKYIQEHKRETKVGTAGADVQTWMNTGKVKK